MQSVQITISWTTFLTLHSFKQWPGTRDRSFPYMEVGDTVHVIYGSVISSHSWRCKNPKFLPSSFFLLSQGQCHPYLVNITMQGCVAVWQIGSSNTVWQLQALVNNKSDFQHIMIRYSSFKSACMLKQLFPCTPIKPILVSKVWLRTGEHCTSRVAKRIN